MEVRKDKGEDTCAILQRFELAIWGRSEKQTVQSGDNGFGIMLETGLARSVVDIGVLGSVGYSPDPLQD